MWYVVQVPAGQEARVRVLIERELDGARGEDGRAVLRECFVPQYQTERKYRGQWRRVLRDLFPGYVVAVTHDADALNDRLRRVNAFTRILGSEKRFIPLDRAEMGLINALTAEKRRVIAMSRGVAAGDRVVITEGPLLGREGWIAEVSRSRSTARVRVTMFGKTVTAKVGLAIVGRRDG